MEKINEFFKSNIFSSVLLMILGFILAIKPNTVISIMAYIVAIILFAMGINAIIKYIQDHNQTFNLIHNLDLSSEERRKQVIKLFSDFNEDYLELERKGALPEWAKLEDSNSDYIQYGHDDDDEIITDFENVDLEKFVTDFEKSQSIDVETFNSNYIT